MIHEFTWRVAASLPKVIGKVPFGTRMYHELPEVELTGERLNARSITPGGDWILAADDGWAHIDVRAQRRGSCVYVRSSRRLTYRTA
jgi:hypothetical protein